MDFQKKNELKLKYYQVFQGKLDTSIVDMVLEGCSYEEQVAHQKLVQMCGEDPLLVPHTEHTAVRRCDVLISNPPYAPGAVPTAPDLTCPPYHTVDPYPRQGPSNKFVPRDLYSLPAPRSEGKCVVPVSQEPSRPPLILKEEKHDKRDDDSSKLAMKLLLSLELLRIIDEVKEESRKASRIDKRHHKGSTMDGNQPAMLVKHEIPKHWPRNDRGVNIIPIKADLFTHIQALFFNSSNNILSKAEIQSIEELCNWNTYDNYLMAKYCMDESKRDINEKELWYAPPDEDVEDICYKSFDVENKRMVGIYGKGKYFYKYASRAHVNRPHEVKEGQTAYIFLANVIIGEYTKGSEDLDYIPLNEKGEEYNTSVDDVRNPSVFVKFYNSHCYPRYLITYKMKP